MIYEVLGDFSRKISIQRLSPIFQQICSKIQSWVLICFQYSYDFSYDFLSSFFVIFPVQVELCRSTKSLKGIQYSLKRTPPLRHAQVDASVRSLERRLQARKKLDESPNLNIKLTKLEVRIQFLIILKFREKILVWLINLTET